MPASTTAILKNVERMAHDTELLALWNESAQTKNDDGTDRTIGQAWVSFVAAADAARVADRIPGAVGKRYKRIYAAEPVRATAKKAASRARKPSTKDTSK
jgi:hypothetical protein